MEKSVHKLIPPFSYPAHAWAEKVKVILEASEVDTTKPEVQPYLKTAITARLPIEVIRGAKVSGAKTATDLIESLTRFDAEETTVKDLLVRDDHLSQKPSLTYYSLLSKLESTMPAGTEKNVVAVVAWRNVCEALPPTLQAAKVWLDLDRPPSDECLHKLDRVWVQGEACSSKVVAAVTSSGVESWDRFEGRRDGDRGGSSGERRTFSNNNNRGNGSNVFRGNQSSFRPHFNLDSRGSAGESSRIADLEGKLQAMQLRLDGLERERSVGWGSNARAAVGHDKENVCTYHKRFGRFARNCVKPCRYHPN